MTTQAAFTPQEWTLLRTVPALVASGVAAADPGGILGGMKEAFAGMKGMFDSLLQGKDVELLQAMVADKSRPEMPDIKAMMGEGDPAQQLINLKARVLERIRPGAKVYAFDTFAGMPATDAAIDAHRPGDFRDANLDEIRTAIDARFFQKFTISAPTCSPK